ncbi:hypothetical protein V7S43_009423 [Phytophthora oleae]|uniref:Uncharacterized protein n=1 Tax=Phytophthora oleae TaxID=2107226 RepID=A0ABD3FEM7_9STRA
MLATAFFGPLTSCSCARGGTSAPASMEERARLLLSHETQNFYPGEARDPKTVVERVIARYVGQGQQFSLLACLLPNGSLSS